MKNLRGITAVAALVLLSNLSAHADAPKSAGDDVGTRFELSALSNGTFFFNGDGSFGIGAVGASVQVIPGLQLSVNAAYLRLQAYGESTWALGFLAGPVVNFPFEQDLRNAFFGSVKYGVGITGNSYSSSSSSNSDNSRGVLDFSVGKRFKLFERLSYTPEFGYSRVLGGNSSTTPTAFRIVIFGFSVFF